MSKVTIHPREGKPRQYHHSKFRSIHPLGGGGCKVVIRLSNKDLEFDCDDNCNTLATEVMKAE